MARSYLDFSTQQQAALERDVEAYFRRQKMLGVEAIGSDPSLAAYFTEKWNYDLVDDPNPMLRYIMAEFGWVSARDVEDIMPDLLASMASKGALKEVGEKYKLADTINIH